MTHILSAKNPKQNPDWLSYKHEEPEQKNTVVKAESMSEDTEVMFSFKESGDCSNLRRNLESKNKHKQLLFLYFKKEFTISPPHS